MTIAAVLNYLLRSGHGPRAAGVPLLPERLETRRLMSSLAAPLDVIGQYTGTAAVDFSPRKYHAPATDTISLEVDGEGLKGALAGTISDSFGQEASVAGRISGHRITLHIVTDRSGSDQSGTLALKLNKAQTALSGSFGETNLAPHPKVSWRGSISAEKSVAAATPTPTPTPSVPSEDILGTYSGTATGTYNPGISDGDFPSQYSSPASITITSVASDGTVDATLSGFLTSPDSLESLLAVGSPEGNVVTFPSSGLVPLQGSSVTMTFGPKGATATGTFDLEISLDIEFWYGTFSMSRTGGTM